MSGTLNNGSPSGEATTPAEDQPPFQLGRCNALRFDGPAVAEYYPRWFGRKPRESDERPDIEKKTVRRTRHAQSGTAG